MPQYSKSTFLEQHYLHQLIQDISVDPMIVGTVESSIVVIINGTVI